MGGDPVMTVDKPPVNAALHRRDRTIHSSEYSCETILYVNPHAYIEKFISGQGVVKKINKCNKYCKYSKCTVVCDI